MSDYPRQIALELPTGLRIVVQRIEAHDRSGPVAYCVITEIVTGTDALGGPIWTRATAGTYYQNNSRTLGRYAPGYGRAPMEQEARTLDRFIEDAVGAFLAREGVTEEATA